MLKEIIKMLDREKQWHEENHGKFTHSKDYSEGFINGITYCRDLIENSENLSDKPSLCKMCDREIVFNSNKEYWEHVGLTPRHPATPKEDN